MAGRTGLMIVNLGTPESTSTSDVRSYLREFLSDPHVFDLPPLRQWMLLNLVVLPFRPAQTAEAYRKVWTERGSPLMFHTLDLVAALRTALPEVPIEAAMRFGAPRYGDVIDSLVKQHGCSRIVVLPLFPQYSVATIGSAVEAIAGALGERLPAGGSAAVVPPYYDESWFLDSIAAVAAPTLESFRPDRVLFSYHGLPERHVRKADPTGSHCLTTSSCCETACEANRLCYRRHCTATTHGLVDRLGLVPGMWEQAFQSRVGREPWLRPYADERVRELARSGTRRLAVLCPSFVTDCVETVEEIGIRAAEDFRAHGGDELRLVPSLNAHPKWVEAVSAVAREAVAADYNPPPPTAWLPPARV